MDFATFLRFKSKDRREKKTKERHLCLSLSAGNIAGTLDVCLCPHVLKTLLYFKCPSCRNLFVVLFAYRVAFFCIFLFSFIRFNLFSLNVLIVFKNITREIGIADYKW